MTAGDSSLQGLEGFILRIPLLFTVLSIFGVEGMSLLYKSYSCSTKAAYVPLYCMYSLSLVLLACLDSGFKGCGTSV